MYCSVNNLLIFRFQDGLSCAWLQRTCISIEIPLRMLHTIFTDAELHIIILIKSSGLMLSVGRWSCLCHDATIKRKHFPRHWPFVPGIHRSPVNSPHKGQWRGALMFSLICAWVNNREAGDLRRHSVHYDVTVRWGEATPNAARISQECLSNATIDVLLWPAKCPEINTIENVWSVV